MPWTEAARREYRRDCPRYASDLTEREWALIEPFMPCPRRLGCPRTTDLREVMNAILYIASTGCQSLPGRRLRAIAKRGRMLPKDLPPASTVQGYFYDRRDSGLLQTIRFALAMETRELEGRETSPSAGVIDSQSAKTTESGGISGYDAGKKIKGRKRHIVVDTIGLMFGLYGSGSEAFGAGEPGRGSDAAASGAGGDLRRGSRGDAAATGGVER